MEISRRFYWLRITPTRCHGRGVSKLLTAYPRTVQPLASSREQLGIPTLITRRCNSSSRFLGNQSRFIGNNSGSRYTTSSSRFSPPEDAQPSSTNSLLETSHYLNPPSDSLESISPTPDQEASSSEITFKAETPSYDLTFTCSPCDKRSTHRITKQGYHKGTVLITCPECKNKHLISDHLKIFSDTSMTLGDIMRQKGEYIRRGTISGDKDVEFWDDEKDGEAQEMKKQEER